MPTDISVIIPAYNEDRYLAATIASLRRAIDIALTKHGCGAEVVVVDDASTDRTAQVAAAFADAVVAGPHQSIAAARNAGAFATRGRLLVFVDADTVVSPTAIDAIYSAWKFHEIHAGFVRPYYETKRIALRYFLSFWRWYAARKNITQGVCQFFDRALFTALGGYNTSLFMAEDTDLYSRAMTMLVAQARGDSHKVIADIPIWPSMRRFDSWPTWRIVLCTNPLITRFGRRYRWLWRSWYDDPPR